MFLLMLRGPETPLIVGVVLSPFLQLQEREGLSSNNRSGLKCGLVRIVDGVTCCHIRNDLLEQAIQGQHSKILEGLERLDDILLVGRCMDIVVIWLA